MLYTLNFDLAATKQKFAYVEFKDGVTDGLYEFTATVESDKVFHTLFGKKNSFTFPTTVDAEFKSLIANLAGVVQEKVPEWSVHNPATADNFYVKVVFDDKNGIFKTNSNIYFDPKDEKTLAIPQGKSVTVKARLMAWFQIAEQKAGVSLNVIQVNFEK